MDFRDQIPGFRKAVERETFERDACFLGLTETLGQFEVLPFTLRHLLTLRVIQSPFLSTGTPSDPKDIFKFLWVVWPQKDPQNKRELLRACRQFNIPWWGAGAQGRAMARVQTITGQIIAYLVESFADWPPTSKAGDSHYSNVVSFCAATAREYGWSEDETLDKPLKKLCQYLAEIRDFYGKPLLNPSGKIVSDWLRTQQDPDSLMGQLLAGKRN